MKSKNRSILPGMSDKYLEIPEVDGEYLFPGAFRDRNIEIRCSFPGISQVNLRQKARQIAAWLYTAARAKLIFDDEPDVFYWAKLSNQIDLDQVVMMGEFSLQFRCLPYACAVTPTVVEQEMNNGDELTLANGGTASTPFLAEVQNPAITGYAAFPALGAGVCPDITLTSLAEGFTLDVNGDDCSYTGVVADAQKVYLDTDRKTVQLDGSNALRYHDGTFPLLLAGNNTLTYSSPNGCRARVKITYNERWL